MTRDEFAAVVAKQLSRCKDTLGVKETIYATKKDRLANFKKAGCLQDCTSERALHGMAAKHTVALSDFIEIIEGGGSVDAEEWLEKITDDINYKLLLLGLLIDSKRVAL